MCQVRIRAAGLLAEVEQLLAAGQTLGRTARQAVGYREALEFLAGEYGWGE
jgi:tRNA A37 N6-isopentenylltransferase MiaA